METKHEAAILNTLEHIEIAVLDIQKEIAQLRIAVNSACDSLVALVQIAKKQPRP